MEFNKILSYAAVYVSTKTHQVFDQLVYISLVVIPESFLRKMQCIYMSNAFSSELQVKNMMGTGRCFWYIYFNYAITEDGMEIYDYHRLRLLQFADDKECIFSFKYNNTDYSDEQLQLTYCDFNTLIIKKDNK